MPHVIRLRGPWECEELAAAVKFTRRFHAPTGLDQETTVWLAIDDLPAAATITLNGRLLGHVASPSVAELQSHAEVQECPARFDITSTLQGQNVLAIELISRPAGPECSLRALPGCVRLEIASRTQA